MKYLALLTFFISNLVVASDAWKNYLNLPTPENAALVILSPGSDQIEEGLDILEIQVFAGDLEAIKLAFRLKKWMNLSAAISEGLSVIVGRSIRSFPEKFLIAIKSSSYLKSCMDVDVYGFEYVDRLNAQLYENTQRLKSILSVNVGELSEIKKECLSRLNAHNQTLKSIIGS
ncbi:MAG: hypothetical protein HRT53_21925 [Colwellia sp.]|nr:hypothetical protein [Colwellia sp.]